MQSFRENADAIGRVYGITTPAHHDLAQAPKSIAVYKTIGEAQKVVKQSGGQNEGVPLHLRNAPTKLMKDFGYGKGYIYPPNDPSSASSQAYLLPSLQGYKFLNWPDSEMNDEQEHASKHLKPLH